MRRSVSITALAAILMLEVVGLGVGQKSIPHTVVSTDDAKTVKSTVLDTDQSFSFTFSKAGTYSYQREQVLPGYRLPIEAIAAVFVAVTGHLGGFLSGVNVPG